MINFFKRNARETKLDIYALRLFSSYSSLKNYIFLDKIQNILDFEKLVDGLYATENIDHFIMNQHQEFLELQKLK